MKLSNPKAEKIFLALLLKNQNITSYIDLINIDYFSTIPTQNIFNAIYKLFISNSPINEATIEQLSKEKCDFLFKENSDDIDTYYHIIRDNYIKKELVALSTQLSNEEKTAEQLLVKTEETLTKLTLNSRNETGSNSVTYEAMKASYDAFNIRSKFGLAGISMIHPELDSILQGLKPSTLNILAARPSTGKSLVAIHILANNALIYGSPSLMVSLEMRKNKVGQRIIANKLNVKFNVLDTGFLSVDDLKAIYNPIVCKDCSCKQFSTQVDYKQYSVINICNKCGSENIETALDSIHKNNTLLMDDTPGMSLFKVMACIKSHKMKHSDLNLVIIDHMGEINESQTKENEENRLARIAKSLRDLSKQLDITIILLCQLNRNVEAENREPESRDLRGSGRIEEHADTITMLYRDIMGKTQDKNIVKCIVTKNRNGQVGSCYVPLDLDYQRVLTTKANINVI